MLQASVPDSVGGHFEGDADDAPDAAQGVVSQNQAEEKRRGLSETSRSAESEDDGFYGPTDENGEP